MTGAAGRQRADPFATVRAGGETTPATMSAAEVDIAILRSLQRIERLLEAQPRRLAAELRTMRAAPIDAADRARLAPLLQLVAEGGLGPDGRQFTSGQLLEFARRQQPDCAPGLGSMSLGKLLARCVDRPVDGVVIRAEGLRDGARTWRLEVTSAA